MTILFRTFLFLLKSTISCGLSYPVECYDSCLELSKLKDLKMLDLQTKSAPWPNQPSYTPLP